MVGGVSLRNFKFMLVNAMMCFLLDKLIELEQLPDMDFPINSKAEGRVLVPWEHREYPNMTQQDSSGLPIVILSFDYQF